MYQHKTMASSDRDVYMYEFQEQHSCLNWTYTLTQDKYLYVFFTVTGENKY